MFKLDLEKAEGPEIKLPTSDGSYTVDVTNRFKGLDLTDRVPDELWTEVRDIYRRQGARPSPRKRNAKRQNGCLRRPYK